MKFLLILKQSIQSFLKNKNTNKAAALSYYMLFALAPLLFLIINLISFFYGTQIAQGQIFSQLQGIVGKESAKMLQTMISHTYSPGDNIIGTAIGIIGVLLSAIGIINHLRESLVEIWKTQAVKKSLFENIKQYLYSIFLLIITGIIFLVSFIFSTTLATIGQRIGNSFPISLASLELMNIVFLLIALGVLCGMFFKFLPQGRTTWKESLLGGFFTSFLLSIGKFGIAFYLGKSSALSIFGASGGLILLLLWIYYSSIIFFFGAEFTKAYTKNRES